MYTKHFQISCLFALLFLSPFVKTEATLGYFAVGYGTKAIGMGGVATAYPQDSIVAAVNPAGMYWVVEIVWM